MVLEDHEVEFVVHQESTESQRNVADVEIVYQEATNEHDKKQKKM